MALICAGSTGVGLAEQIRHGRQPVPLRDRDPIVSGSAR